MAGRTGGIWRRLRYRDKWKAIHAALSPDQSEEDDRNPATRARFSLRGTPQGSLAGLERIDKPAVDMTIFGIEITKEPERKATKEKASGRAAVASPKKEVARKSEIPKAPTRTTHRAKPGPAGQKRKTRS